jgi:hypothetical protein
MLMPPEEAQFGRSGEWAGGGGACACAPAPANRFDPQTLQNRASFGRLVPHFGQFILFPFLEAISARSIRAPHSFLATL